MDIEGLGRPEPVRIPDLVHDLLPSDDLARIGHEKVKEVELTGRHVDGLALLGHRAGGRIQADRSHLDGGAPLRWLAPPHDGSDPRRELTDGEGFDDVIVGPELEPEYSVDLLASSGEHDDGHARLLADVARQVPPVATGQHHVEEDEVRELPGARFARDRQCRRDLWGEPLAFEALGQGFSDGLLVLHDQDARLHERDGTAGQEPFRGSRGYVLSSARLEMSLLTWYPPWSLDFGN